MTGIETAKKPENTLSLRPLPESEEERSFAILKRVFGDNFFQYHLHHYEYFPLPICEIAEAEGLIIPTRVVKPRMVDSNIDPNSNSKQLILKVPKGVLMYNFQYLIGKYGKEIQKNSFISIHHGNNSGLFGLALHEKANRRGAFTGGYDSQPAVIATRESELKGIGSVTVGVDQIEAQYVFVGFVGQEPGYKGYSDTLLVLKPDARYTVETIFTSHI